MAENESPMKFDVEVLVESVDLPIDQTKLKHSGNIIKTRNDSDKKKYVKIKINSDSNCIFYNDKNRLVNKYLVSEFTMRKEIESFFRKKHDFIDKMIKTEIKNCWFDSQNDSPTSHNDDQLQMALTSWKLWQGTHMTDETPQCYKCYACNQAWWHLSQFQSHIVKHSRLQINVERTKHQCNIVASLHGKQSPKLVSIAGKCPKCAKTYKEHLAAKHSLLFYKCALCHRSDIPTCRELLVHETSCVMQIKRNITILRNITCQYCKASFADRKKCDEHKAICHLVRSDVPVCGYDCRRCTYCDKSQCMATQKSVYICKFCNVRIKSPCIVSLHMVEHSENYAFIFVCKLCPKKVYFSTEHFAKQHVSRHRCEDESIEMFYKKIIVPKYFLNQEPQNVISNNFEQSRSLLKFPINGKATVREVANNENSPAPGVTCSVEQSVQTVVEIKREVEDDQEEFPTIKEEIEESIDELAENDMSAVTRVENNVGNNTEDTTSCFKQDFLVKQEPVSEEEESMDMLEIKEEPLDAMDLYEDDIILFNNKQGDEKEIVGDGDDQNVVVKRSLSTEENGSDDISSDDDIEAEDDDDDEFTIEGFKSVHKGVKKKRCKGRLYVCRKCSFRGKHREYKEHVLSHVRRKRRKLLHYKCTKCGQVFDELCTYTAHLASHRPKKTCPECFCVLNEDLLPSHIKLHVKTAFRKVHSLEKVSEDNYVCSKSFNCIKCNKSVAKKDFFAHWEAHLKWGDNETRKNQDKQSISPIKHETEGMEEEQLQMALKYLTDQQLDRRVWQNCFVCNKRLYRRNDFKRHLVEHLLKDACHKVQWLGALCCQLCDRDFKSKDLYKAHMRDHGHMMTYECTICDRKFSDSSNFTKHHKAHALDAVTCDLCSRRFKQKKSLIKHLQNHVPPMNCTMCDRVFRDRSVFKKHIKMKHTATTHTYKCPYCDSRFVGLKNKREHIWLAHRDRHLKVECPLCADQFLRYIDLKKHVYSSHNTHKEYLKAYLEKARLASLEVRHHWKHVRNKRDSRHHSLK